MSNGDSLASVKSSKTKIVKVVNCGKKRFRLKAGKKTGSATVELHCMGVLKQFHRNGVGRALVDEAKLIAGKAGYAFMQVKTVQSGYYEEYDRTNAFYKACGFSEFEVFPELWGEANPCQVYVMSLK